MSVVLGGKVDQIILTGGIAYNAKTQEDMKAAVEWIAPVTIYPGEDELLALAQGALRVVTGLLIIYFKIALYGGSYEA